MECPIHSEQRLPMNTDDAYDVTGRAEHCDHYECDCTQLCVLLACIIHLIVCSLVVCSMKKNEIQPTRLAPKLVPLSRSKYP